MVRSGRGREELETRGKRERFEITFCTLTVFSTNQHRNMTYFKESNIIKVILIGCTEKQRGLR